jgi:hypothetical protein
MPVMLKHNNTTELCVTNGAEATAHGWQSPKLPDGTAVLDVLFVPFHNPSRDINLPDLPVNVVPAIPTKAGLKVAMPDNTEVDITREQVHVVLNFAMTDYNSQERTRMYNRCDLKYSTNHQHVYTTLSRCSSLKGSLILRDFDASKITKPIDSDLCREFCIHEVLDDITRMSYKGTLPSGISRDTRAALVDSYYAVLGDKHCPPFAPQALNWSSRIASLEKPSAWAKYSSFKPAETDPPAKRRADNTGVNPNPTKMNKIDGTSAHIVVHSPTGIVWDPANWSCAYDSVLVVVADFCAHAAGLKRVWALYFSPLTLRFLNNLHQVSASKLSFENCCDNLRDTLSGLDPKRFPRCSKKYADATEILRELFTCSTPYATLISTCSQCGDSVSCNVLSSVWDGSHIEAQQSTSDVLNASAASLHRSPCRTCHHMAQRSHSLSLISIPPMIVLTTNPNIPIANADRTVSMPVLETEPVLMELRGVIYFGSAHFTCRVIRPVNKTYYHDRASASSSVVAEPMDTDLTSSSNGHACAYVYVPVST